MKTIALLFLFVCLTLTSCSRAFVFQVFNNTGRDIVVISYDAKLNTKEFEVPSTMSNDVWFTTKLEIQHGDAVWRYAPVPVNDHFHYSRTAGPIVQKIQIEPDGSIYVLPSKAKGILKELPTQPDGFPVKPLKIR